MSEFKFLMNCRCLLYGAGTMWLLSISQIVFAAFSQVIAVRVWSSFAYTRIVIESNRTLKYKNFILGNPKCIVIDFRETYLNSILRSIKEKICDNDPYVKSINIRQSKQDTVRLLFNLKQDAKLKLASLTPIYGFRERLVINFCSIRKANIRNDLLIKQKNFNKKKIKQKNILKKNNIYNLNKLGYNKFLKIMIDPGHGGEDFGAVGKHHTKEKDIVLQIACRLKKLIDKENNMLALMTRNKDIFIPLHMRVFKAQKKHADLFISIHADAFTNSQSIGSSVFALSARGAISTAVKYLANTKKNSLIFNGIKRIGDRYVDSTIFDMVQSLTIKDSLKFGKAVLRKLAKVNKLHKNYVKKASFAVLKSPDIPSILIELAFISNIKEEYKLKNKEFQQKIAESILAGIKSYFSEKQTLKSKKHIL